MIRTQLKCALIVAALLAVTAPVSQKASADPPRHESGQQTGQQAGQAGLNSTRPNDAGTSKAARAVTSGDTQVTGNGAAGRPGSDRQPGLAGADSARGGAGQAAGQSQAPETPRTGVQSQTARPAGPIVTFPEISIRWMMAAGSTVLLGALLFMLDRLRRQAEAGMEMNRGNMRSGHP